MDDLDQDIGQALERLARRRPTAPAIHVPGRLSLSYADLGAQIRYVRERLSAWEIDPGNIVAGVIPPRPEMALACATVPAAATFAPLSPGLTTDVYSELLTRLRPKALIVPKWLDHRRGLPRGVAGWPKSRSLGIPPHLPECSPSNWPGRKHP